LKTAGETLHKQVVVKQYASVNDRTVACDDPVLDTNEAENDIELNREAEERTLYRMAKVHNIWSCDKAATSSVLRRRNYMLN
jgi:hypothetical protein